MCGQNRGDTGVIQLSRGSHRKTDHAIPNQVGSRRPVRGSEKDEVVLTRCSAEPVPSSRTRRTTLTGGSVARSTSSTTPPPSVRRSATCMVVGKPRYHSVPGAWGGGRRSVVTLLLLLRLLLRLQERGRGGGGGFLAAGHARKNSRCGGMRGRLRSRRTPAAKSCLLESTLAPIIE